MRILKNIPLILLIILSAASLFMLSLNIIDMGSSLELSVVFDRDEYEEGDEVLAYFEIENTGKSDLSNITLSITPSAGTGVSAASPDTEKEILSLASGESAGLYTVIKAASSSSDDTAASAGFFKTHLNLICVIIFSLSCAAVIVLLRIRREKGLLLPAVFAAAIIIALIVPVSCRAAGIFSRTQQINASVKAGDQELSLTAVAKYSTSEAKSSGGSDTWSVVFISDGGTIVVSQTIADGDFASEPDIPEYDDNYFGGWYTDRDASEYFNFDETPITEDTVLYAVWADDIWSWDADGDGITDGDEETLGSDKSTADDTETDTDGDGLCDYLELYAYGSDITLTDTDGDGLTDYEEAVYTNTDPTLYDTDGDGIADGDTDEDGDGLGSNEELAAGTDPMLADTDEDGLTDYEELMNTGTDPLDADTDDDSAPDGWEYENGYDPLKADTSFTVKAEITAEDGSAASVSVVVDSYPDSLTICETTDGDLLSSQTPGYICSAYNISADGEISSVNISVSCEDTGLSEDSDPRIYYLDSETQLLSLLETEAGDTSYTAQGADGGTYVLLDKTVQDTLWSEEILSAESSLYTDSVYNIVFVIDYSSSMNDNDADYSRLTIVNEFIEKLRDGQDYAAIVKFAAYATTLVPLTTDKEMLTNAVSGISNASSDGCTDSEAGTNGSDGLHAALEELEGASGYKYIIFLTDGEDTTSSYSYDDLIAQAVEDGVVIYSIGMGDADTELLTNIAESTGGEFHDASSVDLDDTSSDGLMDAFHDIMISTIDIETDTNEDGISDYYTKLIAEGTLTSGTGTNPYEGLSYDDIQADSDLDGDGLLNGQETVVTYDEATGKVYLMVGSSPLSSDSDSDGVSDAIDTEPFEEGLEGGAIGTLTIISCYGSGSSSGSSAGSSGGDGVGWTGGHVFFIFTSYVDTSLDFSGLVTGWSKTDSTKLWSSNNITRDYTPTSAYSLEAGESITIGNGALDGGLFSGDSSGGTSGVSSGYSGSSDSASGNTLSAAAVGDANGVTYNMETYKYFAYGYKYLYNTYLTQDVTMEDMETLLEYLSRDDVSYWSLIHNCAAVACSAWNIIADVQVSPYNSSFLLGLVATPLGLTIYMETLDSYGEYFIMSDALGVEETEE